MLLTTSYKEDKGVRTKSWTKTHVHREKCILKNNTTKHWKFMKKTNLLRKQFRGWAILRGDRLYTIGSIEKDYSQRKIYFSWTKYGGSSTTSIVGFKT